MRWLLSKDIVTSLIEGAKTVDRLQDNLEATSSRLGEDKVGPLEELDNTWEYPGRMVSRGGDWFTIQQNFSK